MSKDFIIQPPPPTSLQPIWLAILVSVGLHGLSALSWPLLAALSKTPAPGQGQAVDLVELTPEEQKRLPNLSASPFKLLQIPGQPNFVPSLPPLQSSVGLPNLPPVDNNSSLYNSFPTLQPSPSLPDLPSALPPIPPSPDFFTPLPSFSTPAQETPPQTPSPDENNPAPETPSTKNWPDLQRPRVRPDWQSLPQQTVPNSPPQPLPTLPNGVQSNLSKDDPPLTPDQPEDPELISGASRWQAPQKNEATLLTDQPPIQPTRNQPPTAPITQKPPTVPIPQKPPILPPNGDKPKKWPPKETLVSIRQLLEKTPAPAPATQPPNVPPQPNNDSVKQECSNLADPNRTRLERDRCKNIGSASNSGGSNPERSPSTTALVPNNNPPVSPEETTAAERRALVVKVSNEYQNWVSSLKSTYPNLETTKPQTIATPYPKETDSQQEASTLVGVLVGARGEILAAKPLMSTGNDALNQAAVEAAKNQKFSSSESGKIKAYWFVVEFKPERQLQKTATTEQQPATPATGESTAPATGQPAEAIQKPATPATGQPAEAIQKPATPATGQTVAPTEQQPAEAIQKPATPVTEQQPVAPPTEQQQPTSETEQPDATSSSKTTL